MNLRKLIIGAGVTLGIVILYSEWHAARADLDALRGAIPSSTSPRSETRTEVVWRSLPPSQRATGAITARLEDQTTESSRPAARQPTQRKAETQIEQF